MTDNQGAKIEAAARAVAKAWNEQETAEARADRLAGALEQIGVYGCGMLNQPAAMNGPEEAWLRRRLAEYERVARAALNEGGGR